LFGLLDASRVTVDVVPCPQCRHRCRFVGADLRSVDVLNWDNQCLSTHERLNAYTYAFTASVTPFSAFFITNRRSYEDSVIELPFCSDETFVQTWFMFVQLQVISSEMCCPTCGLSPKIVISD
ncbi:uncharacterized protein B0H18DRAFT_849405, partial [Fomitopsis serialis]|uniref:uncharacterized protein n=1 Tax=Fomitopsis serialis TaxID=139415 RepID=UPI002007214B